MEYYLEHHGVKGMKWGIRKVEKTLGRARKSVVKTAGKYISGQRKQFLSVTKDIKSAYKDTAKDIRKTSKQIHKTAKQTKKQVRGQFDLMSYEYQQKGKAWLETQSLKKDALYDYFIGNENSVKNNAIAKGTSIANAASKRANSIRRANAMTMKSGALWLKSSGAMLSNAYFD